MESTVAFFNEWILPHWPFFAAAIIFGYLGVAMKRVLKPEVVERSQVAWWLRATLPLHPVFTGIVVGAFNVLPTSAGVEGHAGSALYFGFAGAVSTWVYNAFKHFMEKRTSKGAPKSLSIPPSAQ